MSHTLSVLEKLNSDNVNNISIAAQESVVAEFLPVVLLQFNDQFPDASTSFTTVGGNKLIKLLSSGEVDIAIVFDPGSIPEVEVLVSQELRVRAVMAADHPLAGESSVTLNQCGEYPLILPDHSWPLRKQIDQNLVGVEPYPYILTSSNSVEFIRKMLTSEYCIGFQTIIGIERQVNDGAFITIPITSDGLAVNQEFSLCVHKQAQRSKPFSILIKLLKDRFDEYRRYY